jgi:hypothetical protein
MTMLISLAVPSGPSGRALAISGTSAQTPVLTGGNVVVKADVECFVTRGTNPTAVLPTTGGTLGGTLLVAGAQYRLTGIKEGERLAFITSGASGTVFYTEGV